jgi:hypothetical protein
MRTHAIHGSGEVLPVILQPRSATSRVRGLLLVWIVLLSLPNKRLQCQLASAPACSNSHFHQEGYAGLDMVISNTPTFVLVGSTDIAGVGVEL